MKTLAISMQAAFVAASLFCTAAAMFCAAAETPPAIAPDFVTSEAVFWLDASTLSEAAGTELDSWTDARGGSYPGVTTYTSIKPQVIEIASGALAGKKAVTFFTTKTVCDMKFSATQSIKTAFFVVDIDQQQYAFLLGGPSTGTAPYNYAFHRDSGGTYRYRNNVTTVQYWNDGKTVADPRNEKIPTGYQLITWSWASAAQVMNICSDRSIADRIGGKRLCEVVAFSRALSDYERSEVEAYLKAKWYDGVPQAAAMTSMFAKKLGATVHFDASVASSFHYEVDGDLTGTKVSRWDDLSGNGNHFVTNITATTPNYGTVGIVAGQPVFDSGAAASGIDLKLGSPVNARTVFLVAEVDRSGNAFWLGDSEQYRFHRGTSGQYAYNNANVLIRPDKGGTIRCNGDSVSDALNTYPEMPGGLSVYVFTTSSNARWGRLGLDRSQTYRHGGKRVAELISFGTALSDENRATIEKMLMEKWRPSEEYVDSVVAGAAVHVDASSAANFNYTDGNITGWKNAGTGADLYRPEAQYSGSGAATAAPYEPGYGAYGYTNGVPAFLMGGRASGIDLMFERLTNVRSVFWVMDINPNTDSFFLNDATTAESTSADYHFHRGYSGGVVGYYAHSSYGAAFINAITRCDRAAVAATAERPPFGTHVYDLVTKQDYTASSLSKDRYITDRSGDRAISELLIFTNAVAGLTRDAISERLQSRWTKRCGWAGAGDAEWGEGKYRVFDADATIPAGGATADGVGFTASATLSGGTLTLGDGGVFASEGATATVSAPVAGKVAAYGPGTVAFAEPLDGADSVTAGRGATLVLKPNGTVTGALTILSDANVEIDVSSLAAGEHATIAFGSLYIEDGRAFEECVTLVGAEGHVLSLSADGRTLHVNDPGVPITAVWNGGASVADAANWTCRNIQGGIVSDALPGTLTTNVTLTAALDLRGQGTALALASDAACDLGGNELAVSGLDAASVPFAKIGNSAAGAAAVLRVEVASGAVTTNSAVALAGNLRLVKCGLGGLFLAKTGQTYTGGTEVTEGTLTTLNYSTHDARWHPLGANGSVITVTTNGANRGVMNLDGLYAECNAYYSFVLNGGLLENIGTDVNNSYGQIPSITLGADSEISVTNSFGMWNGEGTTKIADLDLGGHVLTVGIADGKDLLLNAVRVSSGTLAATATGSTGHLFLDDCNNRILMATNATFLIDCGIASTAAAAGLAVDVGDYHALYAGDFNTGDHPFSVFGTFKPSAHDLYRGCTMQNGSTIDLSSRTNALPAVSAFATGANALAFAEGATVAVKLGSRRVSSRTPVISWNQEEPPENIGTVSFIGGDEGRSRRFIKKADGLYITGGLILFVK